MGAQVEFIDNKVQICGPMGLSDKLICVPPDRIVAGSLLFAGLSTGTKVRMPETIVDQLPGVTQSLALAGVIIDRTNGTVSFNDRVATAQFTVSTGMHPKFPTDLLPVACGFAAGRKSASFFRENVHPYRWGCLDAIRAMGAGVSREGSFVRIVGNRKLISGDFSVSGIRETCGATIAAMQAQGLTRILNVNDLKRGYENWTGWLKSCGVEIAEVQKPYEMELHQTSKLNLFVEFENSQ